MQTDSLSNEVDEDPSGVHPRARRNLGITAVTTVAALVIGGGLLVIAAIIGPRPEVAGGDPPKPPEVVQVDPVPPAPAAPESFIHMVKRGETLSGIADLYHIKLEELKVDNMLAGNVIYPGDRLTVSCATMASVKPKPCRVGDK